MQGSRIRAGIVAMAVAAALIPGAVATAAQLELGVLQGIVTDEEGNPVEDAVLVLRDPTRGRTYELKSDKNGRLYRRGLPPVTFEFTLTKEGYQPVKDKVDVQAGVDRRVDFKLVRVAPEGAEEFVKGVEAFNSGDSAKAVAMFEEAARKAPEAPEVHINLALAYLRVKRYDDAVGSLKTALSLAPNEPKTLFQLGGAYVDAKKYGEAISAFEKGLSLQPDLNDTLAFEASLTLANVYFAEGQIDKARALFEKTAAVKPDAAGPTLGLGKCAFNAGDVDKALQLFKQVTTSAPGTPEAAEADAYIKALTKKDGGQG